MSPKYEFAVCSIVSGETAFVLQNPESSLQIPFLALGSHGWKIDRGGSVSTPAVKPMKVTPSSIHIVGGRRVCLYYAHT